MPYVDPEKRQQMERERDRRAVRCRLSDAEVEQVDALVEGCGLSRAAVLRLGLRAVAHLAASDPEALERLAREDAGGGAK